MQNISQKLEVAVKQAFRKAPIDTGNLSYAMQSTPTSYGVVTIINLGKDWKTKAKKSSNYNYGQLLNDKRIIRNRESKNVETRIRNREQRRFTNTRSVWVKDKKYGNTIRITNRQYQISVEKSRKQKYESSSETKDYIFVRNDTSIPTISRTSRPVRTNRHYGYLNNICEDLPKILAKELNGTLHKGDYEPQTNIRKPKKTEIDKMKSYLMENGIGGFDDVI